MSADPKPEKTAIIKSRQSAVTGPCPHRPQIMFDSFECKRFQSGFLFPKDEILTCNLLNIWWQSIEILPKIRQSP
jgi:hypothetical protein